MNINTNGKASSSGGISGLASGMDTDAMVEAMLSGVQNRINKQNALRQQTVWKQTILRDVITQINSFQKKYTQVASGLRDANLYNAMKAISSSNNIKVSAKSGAPIGKTDVRVDKLATASRTESQVALSGKVTGEFDPSALDKKVTFETNGREFEVDLSSARNNDDVKNLLNNYFMGSGTSVDLDDKGNIKFTGDVRISAKSTSLGLRTLGLSAGQESAIDYLKDSPTKGLEVLSGKINLNAKASLNVTLDGVTKSIELDANDVSGSFQKGLEQFGRGNVIFQQSGNSFSLTTSPGRRVSVSSGDATALNAVGVTNNESNALSGTMKLKDLNFNVPLQGDKFTFEINGKTITATGDTTFNELLGKINQSGAGVYASYNGDTDKFSIVSSSTGSGFDISMSQSEGNLLSALTGETTGGSVTSGVLTKNNIQGTGGLPAGNYIKGTFNYTVNGLNYSVTLKDRYKLNADGNMVDSNGDEIKDASQLPVQLPYTADEVLKEINKSLEVQFGYTEDGRRAMEIDSNGNFIVNNGATVEFKKVDTTATGYNADEDFASQFGFANTSGDTSNLATADTTLAELGLTGLGGLSSSDKLSDLGSGLSFADGRISFNGSDNSVLGAHSEKLFNTSNVELSSDNGLTQSQFTAGENAKVNINGVDTERSNNNFEYNGLTIDITFAKVGEAVTINSERDTSKIYDTIKGFVDEYNSLIKKLNELIDEPQDFKKYAPLTDEQRKDMSENEVKLWEEKAQKGLLRRDSTISSFLSTMRTGLYNRPAGSKYALFDVGIETSGDALDKGKLVIKDEAKLKNLIDSDLDGIMNLFRGNGMAGSGLIGALNTTLEKAAKTTGVKGSLVEIAGYTGSSNLENMLTKRINDIDSRVKSLKYSYDLQKQRYWKQFNAMEQTVSRMGSQSSWLSQQFA